MSSNNLSNISTTSSSNNYAIGIDLGTTYCCNAIYRNNRVEIIPNNNGNRTTPSYISFLETEKLIGESAKNNIATNAANTVFDIKRIIGRNYVDQLLQNDMKYFPFNISNDENTGKPRIKVNYMNEEKLYFPEQLSAMLLAQLKVDAEEYLGEKITNAVITVPAYFNNTQRESTKQAGEIAGLNVLRIINEPTAASIAYGFNLSETDKCADKYILVFDLGGGTLDVSILNICKGTFEVKSTSGDTHLGGEDFDNKLVKYCTTEFAKFNELTPEEIISLLKDARALRRLRSNCEIVKKSLSSCMSANVQVDSFFNSLDLNVKITRAKFEELCHDQFMQCITPMDQAIQNAKLNKTQIDEIIMIGGSTRIPYVRELVKNYFNGKQLRFDINPDEAVAYGAAVQAAILSGRGKSDNNLDKLVLIDVTPLSLGIEISNGEMSKIIERNTQIPCSKEQLFSTQTDNQRSVKVKIFEGERALTKDNTLLGIFELSGLPPMPRGIPRIKVTFDIDANGILQVSATEESTGKIKNIIINKDRTHFERNDVEKMISNANENAKFDEIIKNNLLARNTLENYIYSVKHLLSQIPADVNAEKYTIDIANVQSTIITAQKWFDLNVSVSAEGYYNKKMEMEKLLTPFLKNIYDLKSSKIDTEKVETSVHTLSNSNKQKNINENIKEVDEIKATNEIPTVVCSDSVKQEAIISTPFQQLSEHAKENGTTNKKDSDDTNKIIEVAPVITLPRKRGRPRKIK